MIDLDILVTIPGKKRQTPSGWHTFNGICCHHRGHNQDRRGRAGVRFNDAGSWSYSCFNCGFKCGLTFGKHFSSNLKMLLEWCGMPKDQIALLSFKCFSIREGIDQYTSSQEIRRINFAEKELPDGARALDVRKDQLDVEYLTNRGINPDQYPFYVVDGEIRKRIIIPYYYAGKLVGHTSRYYDNRSPKYVTDTQAGYVFNIDGQRKDWNVCLLMEGQFDAISIGGCAVMHSTISDEQAELLKRLQRRIIYVPDRDKTGLAVCDRALELGYNVSIPSWKEGIKDVNDAVKTYGKLPTLMSILQSATSSKIIVEMKRKKLA
jgi:hypothetical protein